MSLYDRQAKHWLLMAIDLTCRHIAFYDLSLPNRVTNHQHHDGLLTLAVKHWPNFCFAINLSLYCSYIIVWSAEVSRQACPHEGGHIHEYSHPEGHPFIMPNTEQVWKPRNIHWSLFKGDVCFMAYLSYIFRICIAVVTTAVCSSWSTWIT